MITNSTIYIYKKKNQKFEILFLKNRLKNIYHKGCYLKSMAQSDT